jgi:hypothetical protein
MLQPVEIMSGFKNIRFVFRTKCKIRTTLSELALRFSVENNVLYVHDLENHDTLMMLATRINSNNSQWKTWFLPNTPGERLITHAIMQNNSNPSMWLNHEYQLNGYIPYRLLR